MFPLRLPGPSHETVATLLPKAKKEKTHCRTAKVCSLRSHGTDRGANSTMLRLLRRFLPHSAVLQAEGAGPAQPSPALARASLLRPRQILPRGNLGILLLGPEGRRQRDLFGPYQSSEATLYLPNHLPGIRNPALTTVMQLWAPHHLLFTFLSPKSLLPLHKQAATVPIGSPLLIRHASA